MIPAAELCFYTKVHESVHSYTLLKGYIHIINMYSRKRLNILYIKQEAEFTFVIIMNFLF